MYSVLNEIGGVHKASAACKYQYINKKSHWGRGILKNLDCNKGQGKEMFILWKRARTNVEVSPWRGVNVEEMQCLFDGVQELRETFIKL